MSAGRFPIPLLLQGLAYAGVVVGYVPFLTLLLPLRLAELSPEIDRVGWLSLCAICGAISASIGNLLAGWLSDRTAGSRMGRRGWIGLGLAGFLLAFVAVEVSRTPAALLTAVVLFQFALNFMLGPMMAAFAEETREDRRGRLGGLLGFVYPTGAVAGMAVTQAPVRDAELEIALVGLSSALLVLPFVLAGSVRPPGGEAAPPRARLADFGRAGVARFLLQIAGGVIFAFSLYYFAGRPGADTTDLPARLAGASALVTVASAPVALVVGWATDRWGGWRTWLATAAAACAAGLAAMALASDWTMAVGGYALFGVALAVFLALHASYAMRLLPSPARRGLDLGLMNLSNTLPSIFGPALAWAVLPRAGYAALLGLLAAFSLAAGFLMLSISARTRSGA